LTECAASSSIPVRSYLSLHKRNLYKSKKWRQQRKRQCEQCEFRRRGRQRCRRSRWERRIDARTCRIWRTL